jgi:fatty acid desaturase
MRVGEAQAAHASDYTALAKRVKDAGLLRRRPGSYLTRVIVLAALYATGFVLLATLGHTWWQLLVAFGFSVVFTQTAFLAHDAAHFKGWLTAHQGFWFIPILALAGLDLHVSALKAIFGGEKVAHRKQEAVLVLVRLIGFPTLVFLLLGPVLGLAFMAVQFASFGIYMGGTFALNHTGMKVIERDEKVDYLRRQVLTSRNISGGRPMEHLMGGLNLQIEHHLFPNMPSANLRKVRPMVREYCAELGVEYVQNDVFSAWRIVLVYLHRVGARNADPFDCPAAGAFRTA